MVGATTCEAKDMSKQQFRCRHNFAYNLGRSNESGSNTIAKEHFPLGSSPKKSEIGRLCDNMCNNEECMMINEQKLVQTSPAERSSQESRSKVCRALVSSCGLLCQGRAAKPRATSTRHTELFYGFNWSITAQIDNYQTKKRPSTPRSHHNLILCAPK